MSDSTYVIAFFVLLFAGKAIIIAQYLRSRRRTPSPSPSSSTSTSPNLSMTDMETETGPEVLVEDPMTQRLLLLAEGTGEAVEELHEIDIQVPPPAYTVKDEHLEFENVPPPPSFADVVPSTLPSSHSPKARRKLSRADSNGSHSSHSHRRWSRHSFFRSYPSTMDNSISNIDDNEVSSTSSSPNTVSHPSSDANRSTMEPTAIQIPNVARWVAESRRDIYQRYASTDSSDHYCFGFVSTFPNSDAYYHHRRDNLQGSSSLTASGTGTMRILPSMGALYPSVIVHM